MGFWDGLLLAGAVLIAVRSLSSLMRQRTARLVEEVQKQVDSHGGRKKNTKRKQPSSEANAA